MDRVERYKAIREQAKACNIDVWVARNAHVKRQTVRVWNMMRQDRAPSERVLSMLELAIELER